MLLTMAYDPHNHGSLGQVIEFDILRPNDPDANRPPALAAIGWRHVHGSGEIPAPP